MKKWTKSRSLALSRIVTWISIALLAGLTAGLPFILKWYIGYSGKSMEIYTQLLIILWISALPALAALVGLTRLLSNIARERVFVTNNVSVLRMISWCCFALTLIYSVFCFFYALAVIIGFMFAFFGLILRVVKNVIAQAIEIKQENDLTV